ncbi:MAG: hypothetical protein WC959_01495 [Kiritimatiellales bacterium]
MMEDILHFLTNDDAKWELDLSVDESWDVFDEHPELDEHRHSSIQSILKQKIEENLFGSDLKPIEFTGVVRHVLLEHHVSQETQHNNAMYFLISLNFIGIRTGYFNADETKWLRTKGYLQSYFRLNRHNPDRNYMCHRPKLIAESVRFLRSLGYEASIERGKVRLSDADEEKFEHAMQYRFARLGHVGFDYIMHMLGSLFKGDGYNRFRFRTEPGMLEPSELKIPLGYLFNVSLSHLNPEQDAKRSAKVIDEVFNISKHFFGVMELQPLLKFEELLRPPETIIDDIQKCILFDQHFAIDQVYSEHMITMMTGIWNASDLASAVKDVDVYLDILQWVSNQAKSSSPLIFTFDQLNDDLGSRYGSAKLSSVLNQLTFEKSSINSGYLSVSDITKRNYFQRPFVHFNGVFLYPNEHLCNYGFYATLLRELKSNLSKGKDEGMLVGDALESFIAAQLQGRNVTFYQGGKYKISADIANDLNINSQEGECDFIVETDARIIFIELKRKTLTANARAGNSVQSLIDLSQSLFHALAQTGCHEYCLRKCDALTFVDGTRIGLKKRAVERIALSLFDFNGIQDDSFINHLLVSLVNATLDSEDKKSLVKIEEHLVTIQNQYRTGLFKAVYTQDGAYGLHSFMNCRFLSVPQMLEILNHTDNNEDFEREVTRTRHMTTGAKDWYLDYYLRGSSTEARPEKVKKAKI